MAVGRSRSLGGRKKGNVMACKKCMCQLCGDECECKDCTPEKCDCGHKKSEDKGNGLLPTYRIYQENVGWRNYW
jgi:hypothetical protein